MAVVGIVFLPLVTAATIIARLSSSFPSAVPFPLPFWSLSHSLYRSTTDPAATTQLLRLSSYPSLLYIHTSSEPATTVAISAADESVFVALLSTKLGALWAPVRGLDVNVTNGEGWLVGALAVRIGEVVATAGAGSGSASGAWKGSVVVLEQGGFGEDDAGDTTEEGDNDAERALLRDFLVTAGVVDDRDTPTVEVWRQKTNVVEAWCEVLRHHAIVGRKVDGKP